MSITKRLPRNQKAATIVKKQAPQYSIIDDILHRRSPNYDACLVALPAPMRRQVHIANHDSLLGRHLGIRKWCRGCVACQSRKSPAYQLNAALQPLPGNYLNQSWGWDICGPLPLSQQGNRYILVCMEYFTKCPTLIAVPDTEAARLAKIIVK